MISASAAVIGQVVTLDLVAAGSIFFVLKHAFTKNAIKFCLVTLNSLLQGLEVSKSDKKTPLTYCLSIGHNYPKDIPNLTPSKLRSCGAILKSVTAADPKNTLCG